MATAKSVLNRANKQYQRYLAQAKAATAANNAWSARQAQIERDWQTRMSATAHQREVADLKAAGINPILSAYSSGASTGSAGAPSGDTSYAQALGQLAQTSLSVASTLASTIKTTQTQVKNTRTSARATVRSARIHAKASRDVAKTQAKLGRYQARVQKEIAKLQAETDISRTQLQGYVQKYIAQLQAGTSLEVVKRRIRADKKLQRVKNYGSVTGTISNLVQGASEMITDKGNPLGRVVNDPYAHKLADRYFAAFGRMDFEKASVYLDKYLKYVTSGKKK